MDGPVRLDDLVGHTPLLHLASLSRESGVPVYAKAEWCNPGGSVKDRPARHILRDAIERDELGPGRPGRRLLDATSGNTGIAYATLAPLYGIAVTLCLPANASRERQVILQALGAELILTDPLEGTDGAIDHAQALARDEPDTYAYVDQYSNDANWRAHYDTTGPEVWQQTHGRITHFVTGLGTTGTLVGTSRYLHEKRADIRIVAVEPDAPFHGLEGLKHLETAHVPRIWDASTADERLAVQTEDAQQMVRRLAREESLLLGPSGGAAALGALRTAQAAASAAGIRPGGREAPRLDNTTPNTPVIVTLFPDNASKYLSTSTWEDTA